MRRADWACARPSYLVAVLGAVSKPLSGNHQLTALVYIGTSPLDAYIRGIGESMRLKKPIPPSAIHEQYCSLQ